MRVAFVRDERIQRRILGDVPGVARRQYFPSPSDEYLSVGSAAGARRGTFRRTCAFHRPGGSVASTKRHSRSVSGPHAPLPRARLSSLSLSLSFSRRPQHPASPWINPEDSPRAESPERYLVESTRFRTIDRSPENVARSRDTRRVAKGRRLTVL